VDRVLTTRHLNRALLTRQLLLERSALSVPKALEQVAGIQAQYAPSTYIRLWTSLKAFAKADLDRLLERRQVVQGTLMRSTIHVVSRRDYWLFAEGIGPSRQQWWQQTWGGDEARDVNLDAVSAQLGRELTGRVWPRKELDAHLKAHGGSVWSGAWVPLIRVPPAGTWTHRRADLFQLSSDWLGPSRIDEDAGLVHLLRRYLGGFGPARLTEAAKWAGVDTVKMAAAAERLTLRTFRTERGTELVDLPRAPLPEPQTPAPVRFLPTWDATLLVHARRTEILPEAYRSIVFNTRTPHSIGTFLVDGQVAGSWKVERAGSKATLTYVPFERLPAATDQDIRDEASGLVRFMEPDAASHAVKRGRMD
jgi:Winged helix DNA-binding domain